MWWKRRNHDLQLKRDGRNAGDPNWAGEVLVDTSTAAKRSRLARLEGDWIDSCARDGF